MRKIFGLKERKRKNNFSLLLLSFFALAIFGMLGMGKQLKAYTVVPITPPTPPLTVIPFPTKTPTPIPTIYPNRPPVITTLVLPIARVGKNYQATVSGYDSDREDILTMSFSYLPSGISSGSCSQKVVGKKKVIQCVLSGRPTKKGSYSVFVLLKDNRGGETSRWLPLFVFPR